METRALKTYKGSSIKASDEALEKQNYANIYVKTSEYMVLFEPVSLNGTVTKTNSLSFHAVQSLLLPKPPCINGTKGQVQPAPWPDRRTSHISLPARHFPEAVLLPA